VTAFQTGNSEAFVASGHWSSTQDVADRAWGLVFSNGVENNDGKTDLRRVRAFRKVAL
jgi:hypothetical protein